MIYKKKIEDIDSYGQERYGYAKKIAIAVIDHLNRMDANLRNLFLSFLSWTKLTVVMEILIPDSMHVEDLSYLNE